MQFPQSQCCNNSYLPPYNGSYSGCGNQYPIVPGGNPALQTWNGQNFVVADGSNTSPISLPFIQQAPSSDISLKIGLKSNGDLAAYSSVSSKYGSFYDTTNQVSAGTTSANLININSTSTANGVSLDNNSKIVISTAGAYYVNILGQFKFTGGGSGGSITVWHTVNGVQIPDSSYTFYLPTNNNYEVLANVEFISDFNAGDYIQFYWWSNTSPAANVGLRYTAAGSNPTRPASPSVNVVVSQLNQSF